MVASLLEGGGEGSQKVEWRLLAGRTAPTLKEKKWLEQLKGKGLAGTTKSRRTAPILKEKKWLKQQKDKKWLEQLKEKNCSTVKQL